MSNTVKEYVFCPYCGGITAPGVCVNCGMSTTGEQKAPEVKQENSNMPGAANQSAQSKYSGNTAYNQPNQNGVPYGNTAYSQPNQNGVPYGNTAYSQPNQNGVPYGNTAYSQPNQSSAPYGNVPYNRPNQSGIPYGNVPPNRTPQNNLIYEKAKTKKKSHWWIWLLILGGILVLGIIIIAIVCVLLIGSASTYISSGLQTTTTVPTQPGSGISTDVDDDDDDYDDYDVVDADTIAVYPRELGRVDLSDCKWNTYASDALVYSDTTDGEKDIFLAVDYSSTFGSNHKNYTIDDFDGQYYEPFVDCIDTDQDYELSRHFMQYSNVHGDVLINGYIAYIQFEGGTIPNEDAINRKILEMTANDLWAHLEGIQTYYATDEEVTFMVDSFVIYNDDEKMSILLDVNIVEYEQLAESYIYAINIDLENGTIMDNEEILETDVDFATMFREKCCEQNGDDIDGLNYLTDELLSEFLSDSDTNIVFFSPYGIEVGYAYETSDYARGWVTITLSDYEQYLK